MNCIHFWIYWLFLRITLTDIYIQEKCINWHSTSVKPPPRHKHGYAYKFLNVCMSVLYGVSFYDCNMYFENICSCLYNTFFVTLNTFGTFTWFSDMPHSKSHDHCCFFFISISLTFTSANAFIYHMLYLKDT